MPPEKFVLCRECEAWIKIKEMPEDVGEIVHKFCVLDPPASHLAPVSLIGSTRPECDVHAEVLTQYPILHGYQGCHKGTKKKE